MFVVALFYGKNFFIRKKIFLIFFPAYRFNKSRRLFSLRFPINPESREKWLRMLNRPHWTSHKYTTICSKHFHPHCFSVTIGQKRRKLRSGSVPTISMPGT
ncbi:unnamed protein product [Parnassius mnemosyne]|uniref:THAP-type domain-containing protein n=1 Tax=Parnassius mnemosyne TaxID=213953 RepID=A0AAV1M820_9NEOP